MCDFSKGFKAPEMTKVRPVVILTPSMPGRERLVTVVCLSSVRPNPIRDYHRMLPQASLPMVGSFQAKETWVKGDMVYAVSFERLDLIKLGNRGADGKRKYFDNRLGRERMREIYGCVLHGLSLSAVVPHLPE